MKTISDMEFCGIIEAVCPYDHSCNVCRLHNAYEDAREKSRKLEEIMEGSKG